MLLLPPADTLLSLYSGLHLSHSEQSKKEKDFKHDTRAKHENTIKKYINTSENMLHPSVVFGVLICQTGYLCYSPLCSSDSCAGHCSSTHSAAICQKHITDVEKEAQRGFSVIFDFLLVTYISKQLVMREYITVTLFLCYSFIRG